MAAMAPLAGMSEEATREIDGLIAEYTTGSAVDAHVVSSNDRIFHLLMMMIACRLLLQEFVYRIV